ncbi:MAG: ABC transporter ATP-binding protein [Candidatus Thorarchaeota archaeon]
MAEALKFVEKKLTKKESKERVIASLAQVGISSPELVYDYYPHQLSGGMKQRAVIAMALITNPSLLIADEPTTNLDVTVQAQVLLLMKELIENTEKSTLIITHDLGIVADLADRVYIMYAGRTVESADVFSIYEDPLHPYTKAMLECTLSVDEFSDCLVCIPGNVPDLTDPPKGCLYHPRCESVMPICSEESPPTLEVEPDRTVQCWLYSQNK